MSSEFHGWKECDEGWIFADVHGFQKNSSVFVINDFGSTNTPREALSAVMAAMAQFPGRVHLRRTEKTDQLLNKLLEAAVLRLAPIRGEEHEEFGVLGVRKATPPKAPWWKFW